VVASWYAVTIPASVTWRSMCMSIIRNALVKEDVIGLSAAAEALVDAASITREEGDKLIKYLRSKGDVVTAQQLRAKLATRVIAENNKIRVVENVGDYAYISGGVPSPITNFSLRFTHNIYMPESGEICHAANLVFGGLDLDIVLPSTCIEQPNKMQDAVRLQMLTKLRRTTDNLPTVIDIAAMRKHIIPYMKQSISDLKAIEGVSVIGWDKTRSVFAAPGMRTDIDGSNVKRSYMHPGVRAFSVHNAGATWEGDSLHVVPVALRDVISMIVATVVRGYVRSTAAPVLLMNDAPTRNVVQRLFAAIGQDTVLELSTTAREQLGVVGVSGYPLLVSGYAADKARAASFPYFVLTDAGYSVPAVVTDDDMALAAATLQHALKRVAEWCIATDAVDFVEASAFYQHEKLLREGSWIMHNVCEAQPWEVTAQGTQQLEALMLDACSGENRLTLHRDMRLHVSDATEGYDVDVLSAELDAMNVPYEFEDTTLKLASASIMAQLITLHGKTPEMNVV